MAHTPEYAVAGEALRQFYVRSNQKLDKLLASSGASFARTRMMAYIDSHPDVRSIDLMTAFAVAPRTITEALDGLERDGLAMRGPDPTDRRAKIITLTDRGKSLLQDLQPIFCQFGEELFSVLSEKDLAQLALLVSRLNCQLDAMS